MTQTLPASSDACIHPCTHARTRVRACFIATHSDGEKRSTDTAAQRRRLCFKRSAQTRGGDGAARPRMRHKRADGWRKRKHAKKAHKRAQNKRKNETRERHPSGPSPPRIRKVWRKSHGATRTACTNNTHSPCVRIICVARVSYTRDVHARHTRRAHSSPSSTRT